MTKFLFSFSLFIVFALSANAQLVLKVTSIPANTPASADIYAAGNFNGWDAENASYQLTPNTEGVLQLILSPPSGIVEFKFTRGGWETVEGNANGGFLPNRTIQYNGGEQIEELSILSWEDLDGGNTGNSTAADNVSSFNFYIPQLNRDRKIWLYLPPDYATSNKSYPVLYVHDGQNAYDVATSAFGEWEIDESLNTMFENGDEGVIVVGIENGGINRLNEYSPWINPNYGGGEGDEYMEFIVETLKPYIDENYRTLSDRDHTGLLGSSMGGLISMYGAIEYQEVFSKAGVFSPSFWFTDECYTHVSNTGKEADMRIYLLAGQQESASMVPDLYAMYNTLYNAGFDNDELFIVTHPDGQHSEWYWRREFPAAYEWLYANPITQTNEIAFHNIHISPNPASDILKIEHLYHFDKLTIKIFSIDGQLIQVSTLGQSKEVDISYLAEGTYIINIYSNKHLLISKKIIIHR